MKPGERSPSVSATHIRRLLAIAALALASLAAAAPLPYDEAADATHEIEQALSASGARGKPVLLVFGANWCDDCRALDAALKQTRTAELMAREFQIVKVDVGRFDRNLDIAARYGNPIKGGIPAAVIVSPRNEVLYATRTGELAGVSHKGERWFHRLLRIDSGVFTFFQNAAASAKTAK